MRWYKHYPENGDTRIIKRFTLFPFELNGEVRWLESINIKQMFRPTFAGCKGWWQDECFVDRKENR